jgi:hypothetical protein
MSPMYDAETFTKNLLPKHFRHDVVVIIQTAAIMGWKVHVTSKKSVTIVSPGERKRYHFGLNSRSSTNLNRIRRDILKYGDPEKVAAADTIIDPTASLTEQRTASLKTPLLGEEGTYSDERPEAEPEDPYRIISRKPMVARQGSRTAYDSETTIERTYANGYKDFVCSWPGCKFTSEISDRLSVARHYGQAHKKGQGRSPQPPIYQQEVKTYHHYAPRQKRIEALAEVIAGLLAGSKDIEPEEIAKAALVWVHEQSAQGTGLAAEREELTPEDTLNRIRNLLDDGSAGAIRTELEERDQQIVALTARVEAAEAQAQSARETLKAFTDLAAELSTEARKAV